MFLIGGGILFVAIAIAQLVVGKASAGFSSWKGPGLISDEVTRARSPWRFWFLVIFFAAVGAFLIIGGITSN